MSTKIALIGVGGNFWDIVEDIQEKGIEIAGYIDPVFRDKVELPYLGDDSKQLASDIGKVLTVGYVGQSENLRKKLYMKHKENIVNLLFETSEVSKFATFHENSGLLVLGKAVVKAGCMIGANVFINTGCIVGHDVHLEDHCQLSLGAIVAGGAKIGCDSFVGMGAKILQGVEVGKGCVIGAGAVVTKNVPEHTLVKGVNGLVPRQ